MSDIVVNNSISELLLSVGQQVINSGADVEEVKSFIKELTPLYQKQIEDLKKQEITTKNTGLLNATDERTQIELPTAQAFTWWQETMIKTTLSTVAPAYILLLGIAGGISKVSGVTIGLGPQVTAGSVIALGGSVGLCTYPDGTLGYYGDYSAAIGAILSISLTLQCTIISGGRENFSGTSYGLGIDGGGKIVGNAAVLFSKSDDKYQFIGITTGVGIGAGIPIELFEMEQHTYAK